MAKFNCNIEDPSCSLPADTGESASGGGGGASTLNDLTDVNTSGVSNGQVIAYDGNNWTPSTSGSSNVVTIANTTEWASKQSTIVTGDTVLITGTGDYSITEWFTGVDFKCTTTANIILDSNPMNNCSIRCVNLEIKADSTFILQFNNFLAQTITITGGSALLMYSCVLRCTRIDYQKTSSRPNFDAASSVICQDFYGTGTADVSNQGHIRAKFITTTVRNEGEITVTNQNFGSSQFVVKSFNGATTTVTKSSGTTLKVVNETLVVNV